MNQRLQDVLRQEIEALKAQHLYRPLREAQSPSGPRLMLDGRPVINLSSNNYLGLNTHPKLIDAAVRATREWGVGSGAVRTIVGTQAPHNELERRLAAWKKVEAATVFTSGFVANAGPIPAIMGAGDVIISDELNHASIIDGVRLAKADRKVYGHSDMDQLEEVLKGCGGYRLKMVVTDGVFSMDGDIAPLPEIVELAERYDALVMVDDAHGSGVLGEHGAGSASHFGLYGRVDIQLGTLSKAVGVVGGYIAGSQALKEFLIHRARPFLFSTSHPPGAVAAIIAAIEVMQTDETLYTRLWDNTSYWKENLRRLGYDIGASVTPITPVLIGDEALTGRFSQELYEAGVFAQAIAYPTVARGKARVRTMISAAHERKDLDDALTAFEEVGRRLGLI